MKQKIILFKKDGKTPFVTKRSKHYFIEGVKYTDDISILLNAIESVKPCSYQELNATSKISTKEEYWQRCFNYQWSGGGLILWHNPTIVWKEELARRGQLPCDKCGNKMHMYYTPWCPICDMKGKARRNLIQMVAHIEAKHGINIHDYAIKNSPNIKDSTSFNVDHLIEWERKYYPQIVEWEKNPVKNYRFNQAGINFCNSKQGNLFFNEVSKAYKAAPDGKALEIPRWDWWNLFTDVYEFSNDSIVTVSFKELLDACTESWQREITQLFIDTFGSKKMRLEVSW